MAAGATTKKLDARRRPALETIFSLPIAFTGIRNDALNVPRRFVRPRTTLALPSSTLNRLWFPKRWPVTATRVPGGPDAGRSVAVPFAHDGWGTTAMAAAHAQSASSNLEDVPVIPSRTPFRFLRAPSPVAKKS